MEKVLLKVGPHKDQLMSVEIIANFRKEKNLAYTVRVRVGKNHEDFRVKLDEMKEFKRRLNVLAESSKKSVVLEPDQIEWLCKMVDSTPAKPGD